MHETLTQSPDVWEESDGIEAAALRAEAWAGEPFLRPDDDPAVALRPGSAIRRALEGAIAELDAGLTEPSSEWKVRYALMLGLERVLSEKPPHLASGTELRRHQVDALAGMLTELIAAVEKENGNGNGNGNGTVASDDLVEEDDEEEDEDLPVEIEDDGEPEAPPPEEDPGAARRYRFRHPTASGKTIAAAGFVEAARTEGVLDPHPSPAARRPVPARAHRARLRRAAHRHRPHRRHAQAVEPDHDPDLRMVRAACR